MTGQLDEGLAKLLASFAVVPPVGGGAALKLWLEHVQRWNRKVDITAARDDAELVDLMLADAAKLAALLPLGRTVVDVGSGAGAPGLPLALLRPDLTVVLAEPMQKRAALMRLALGKLKADYSHRLPRVEQARGEELTATFDVALSRATLPPPKWLALGAKLAPSGDIWLLLAREPAPALDGWVLQQDETYRWPLTGAVRRLVRYRAEPF